MVPVIEERRELNAVLDAALAALVKALRRHVAISDDLSDKYAQSEREANGNSRPVFDAGKYRSADLVGAWLMGHLNVVPGLSVDPLRSTSPTSPKTLDRVV